jgi:hypothetical protein
LRRDE